MNTNNNPERGTTNHNNNDSNTHCDVDILKTEIDSLQKQLNALEQKYKNDFIFEYDNYQKEKNDYLLLIYAISSALLLLIAAISVRINFYSLSLLATAFTIISIYKVFECALRLFHYFCRRKIHVRKITKEK